MLSGVDGGASGRASTCSNRLRASSERLPVSAFRNSGSAALPSFSNSWLAFSRASNWLLVEVGD
jgi:hypothetical protein